MTLMEHLPPVGWADVATRRDLDGLQTATRRDLDLLDQRVGRQIADLRAELHRELAAMQRNLCFGFLTAQAGFAALILGFDWTPRRLQSSAGIGPPGGDLAIARACG